jgi:hypothetical protein
MERTCGAGAAPGRPGLPAVTKYPSIEPQQRQTQAVGPGAHTMTMTTEIPQKSWDSFCQRLKDWYRGVVSIRWIQPGGVLRVVAEDLPLQRFVFQKQDQSCSDTMTVEAGLPNERPLQHEIIEPFRVVLRKNDESGRYNELEILAETGKTEISFTPGLDPTLLEKLAA